LLLCQERNCTCILVILRAWNSLCLVKYNVVNKVTVTILNKRIRMSLSSFDIYPIKNKELFLCPLAWLRKTVDEVIIEYVGFLV